MNNKETRILATYEALHVRLEVGFAGIQNLGLAG